MMTSSLGLKQVGWLADWPKWRATGLKGLDTIGIHDAGAGGDCLFHCLRVVLTLLNHRLHAVG